MGPFCYPGRLGFNQCGCSARAYNRRGTVPVHRDTQCHSLSEGGPGPAAQNPPWEPSESEESEPESPPSPDTGRSARRRGDGDSDAGTRRCPPIVGTRVPRQPTRSTASSRT
jgi:hypothetical protein